MNRLRFIPDNYSENYLCAGNIGMENNNPGNIRYSANITWQGQVGEKNGFVDFASMPYGYRALMKNLQAYINGGTDTIKTMISKWCPPGDGCNTQSYIDHVSQRTGINPNKKISANDLNNLASIAGAISISEIGTKYDNHILTALGMLQGGAQNGTANFDQNLRMKNGLKLLGAIGLTILTIYIVDKNKKDK